MNYFDTYLKSLMAMAPESNNLVNRSQRDQIWRNFANLAQH